MLDECTFTVVIPVFNRARLIGRAIESVLGQSFAPSQVVVVDDGSTDNTPGICEGYEGRIRYVRQPNSGVSAARNSGIRSACHPWVAFLDSDDLWTPRHLENLRTAIQETSGAAAFYFSNMRLAAENGGRTLWELGGFNPPGPFHFTSDATDWMLMNRLPAMPQCSVFNRAVLERQGAFDPRYRVAEDTELFCRLGIAGPACAVTGVGCIQTSDDGAQNRLTHGGTESSEHYLEHYVMLWRGMLKRFPSLAPHHRGLIRFNYAGSFLARGRLRWRSRRFVAALHDLALSAWEEPRLAAWMMRRGTSKGYEQFVRG